MSESDVMSNHTFTFVKLPYVNSVCDEKLITDVRIYSVFLLLDTTV